MGARSLCFGRICRSGVACAVVTGIRGLCLTPRLGRITTLIYVSSIPPRHDARGILGGIGAAWDIMGTFFSLAFYEQSGFLNGLCVAQIPAQIRLLRTVWCTSPGGPRPMAGLRCLDWTYDVYPQYRRGNSLYVSLSAYSQIF